MTRHLLDVSVLMSILDPLHSYHEPAFSWFLRQGMNAWATCPITENGAIRVLSQPTYANAQGSPAIVAEVLRELTTVGNHIYIADNISILDDVLFDHQRLLTPNQLTDTYLLALAASHDAVFATLDKRIVTAAVRIPDARVHIIA